MKGDVVDLSLPRTTRTFLQVPASLAGAAGIAPLIPFVILPIGLPVALVNRGIAESALMDHGLAIETTRLES